MEPEVLYDKLSHMVCSEIVSLCEEHGVQGVIQEGEQCALAMLFYKLTGIGHVHVNSHIVVSSLASNQHWEWQCTDEISDFISRFDEGQFPEITWGYELDD